MRRDWPRAYTFGIGIVLLCSCLTVSLMIVGATISNLSEQERQASSEYAREVALDITDYDLPDGYQEQVGLRFLQTRLVMIAPDPTGQNMAFVMMQFADDYTVTEDFMLEQLRLNWRDQSGQELNGLTQVDRQPIDLRQQETIITTFEGQDERGRQMRQMVAIFEGKTGPAILMITGPVDDWDQAGIDLFLESLR